MKFAKVLSLGLAGLFFLTAGAPAETPRELALREYLPGDIVHILIDAPIDTASITAVMPDGSSVQLGYDARSNLWHGYWEIPPGFKKGQYRARLIASDVAGNTFEGKSSAFLIAEPVLALMTRIFTGEAPLPLARRAPGKLEAAPELTAEAVPAARLPVRETKPLAQPAAEEVEAPARPVVKKVKPAAKPAARAPARKPEPRKQIVSVVTKADSSLNKAELAMAVRSAMSRAEYEKARSQLQALLRIDPNNREAKTILNRLEVVIRAKGTAK
ncbi:MAG: hypothetical protein JW873_00775 [Candidatus Saganbacteria bacterium]|nr:hypothetical protein [Candidatus Saganbacteria bacterium]